MANKNVTLWERSNVKNLLAISVSRSAFQVRTAPAILMVGYYRQIRQSAGRRTQHHITDSTMAMTHDRHMDSTRAYCRYHRIQWKIPGQAANRGIITASKNCMTTLGATESFGLTAIQGLRMPLSWSDLGEQKQATISAPGSRPGDSLIQKQ